MAFIKNQEGFNLMFQTEEDCVEYLSAIRWPHGFVCPKCKSTRYWKKNKGRFECRNCHKESTITNGTLFHKSTKSLLDWFRALWWVAGQKNGMKASELQKTMGLGSYQTASSWLQKFRLLMMLCVNVKLKGTIELDKINLEYGLALYTSNNCKGPDIIAIAQELKGHTPGQVRLSDIDTASPKSLEQFIVNHIEPPARIITAQKECFDNLEQMGYEHKIKAGTKVTQTLPGILRTAQHFETWILGSSIGLTPKNNLQYLIGEYAFRYENQVALSQGLLFFRLIERAVHTATVSDIEML